MRLVNRFRLRFALRWYRRIYFRGWSDAWAEASEAARPMVIVHMGDAILMDDEAQEAPSRLH